MIAPGCDPGGAAGSRIPAQFVVVSRKMAKDTSIFGLRFRSNADLNPTRDELEHFLASMNKAGTREPQGSDLVRYHGLIDRIREFAQGPRTGAQAQDIRDRMFYGVLDISQFFNPALELAVGQFKYHLHLLAALDIRKTETFIRSAEQEIATFDPKKKEHAARLARLREMVEERKQALPALKKRRADLVQEVNDIAHYIRDNLVRIERLCEASIVILVGLEVSQEVEKQLINDIRDLFKDRLRDSLQRGPVSQQQLEEAKRDVAVLSREISALVREDVYALTSLYEAVLDHARCFAGSIEGLLTASRSGQGDLAIFTELERVLVALVKDFRFVLKAAAVHSETAHEDVLREKRWEMLDRIFAVLEQERRVRGDRRSSTDRRKEQPPATLTFERRKGQDRRSGKSRRRGWTRT
jgi:uncharacterized protein YeeX (DUF496 family)